MSKFGVTNKKEEELYLKMENLSIFEDDIEEKFIKSSGKGGQNVNKNSTCVQLKHLPSGIIVKYQKERTQNLNRFFARRALIEKLDKQINGAKSSEILKREKLIKQKQKRKKRAKKKLEKID
ncbi:MAG TPA: peptide chain release factor-like protein [Thermodesulfobacteriota bacterium]|nr:peptide chain release factor-like protein [Thermodesulfobacteriota bacterium]